MVRSKTKESEMKRKDVAQSNENIIMLSSHSAYQVRIVSKTYFKRKVFKKEMFAIPIHNKTRELSNAKGIFQFD